MTPPPSTPAAPRHDPDAFARACLELGGPPPPEEYSGPSIALLALAATLFGLGGLAGLAGLAFGRC